MRYHLPQPSEKQRANASKHKSKLTKQNLRTSRLMEAAKKREKSQ